MKTYVIDAFLLGTHLKQDRYIIAEHGLFFKVQGVIKGSSEAWLAPHGGYVKESVKHTCEEGMESNDGEALPGAEE